MKIDNLKKPGLFAAGVLFGTQESRFSQARTPRNFILTAQQQF